MIKKISAFLLCFVLFTVIPNFVWAAEKVSIEMWHAMKYEKKDAIDELVKKFMKENPDISVTPKAMLSPDVRLYGNDYSFLYRKIIQGLAENNPPDVAQVYENWTTQFVEINAITPFSHFDGSEAMSKKELDDFFPIFRNASSYDGVMWTMPFNKSIYVLYYNKDLLDKSGVKIPKTWDDLKSAAIKISEDSDVYGIAFSPTVDLLGHIIYSNKGWFISDNKAVFNDDIGVASLNYWNALVNHDKAGEATFNSYQEFLKGNAAFIIETTSRIGSLKNECKFNYGITLLPTGRSQAYQCAGTNLAIFSKDEAKKLAAWKLIKFFARKENNIELSIKTGYLPTRYSAYNSPEYQKFLASYPGYKVGIAALNYGITQPRISAWESIRGFVNDAVFDAISGNLDSKDALNKAADYSNGLLKGFK